MTSDPLPVGVGPPGNPFTLDRREKRGATVLFTVIVAATAVGFVVTFVVGRTWGIFIGLGVLAYTLGLRHGVDADHICAIDNTTRKLLQDGQKPYTVGTWFSLGHSTIVMAMLVGLVFAARAVAAGWRHRQQLAQGALRIAGYLEGRQNWTDQAVFDYVRERVR